MNNLASLGVRAVGDSSGAILPKAILEHLGVRHGERLVVAPAPGAIVLILGHEACDIADGGRIQLGVERRGEASLRRAEARPKYGATRLRFYTIFPCS